MIAGAQQILGQQRIPAIEDQVSRLPQANEFIYFGGTLLPERTGGRLRGKGGRTRRQAFGFLLAMAAISVAREIGDWILGDAPLAWFGVPLDPFAQAMVLQLVISLLGIGVATGFLRATADPAARRHVLITLLAATGIGLLLALLGHLIDCSNALSWPLIPVYLFWAWAEAVSGPIVPMTSA